MQLPKIPRFFFKTIFRLILSTLFVFLPAALSALYFWGLPQPLTERLTAALSGKEYRVSIGRLRLNPLRGPVAENVSVKNKNGETLLRLDRLVVALNLSELLKKKVQVETLELDEANIVLPVAPDTEIAVSNIRARLLLREGLLRISYANFTFGGIRVSLTGNLLHPYDFAASKLPEKQQPPTAPQPLSPAPAAAQPPPWKPILDIFEQIRFPDRPASLQLDVSGDLSDLTSLSANTVLLESGHATWKSASLDSLRLVADYSEGVLNIESLDASDSTGTLHATGSYSHRDGKGNLFLRSSANPFPWVAAAKNLDALREISITSPPELEAQATVDRASQETPVLVTGSLSLKNFSVKQVPITEWNANFSWKPGKFLTRGMKVVAPAVSGTFDAMVAGQTAYLKGSGEATPTLCMNWLDAGMKKVFGAMEMPSPGKAWVSLEIPLKESAKLRGNGQLWLGKTALRGAWIDSAFADFQIADRAVTYRNMQIKMGKGAGTGTFVYDFGKKEVRFSNIHSTLPPAQFLLWIDEDIAKAASPFRLRGYPLVQGEGKVDMREPEKTRIDLSVSAKDGIDYELLGRDLNFGKTDAKITVRGRMMRADISRAALFGGSIKLKTDVSLDRRNPTYQLGVSLDSVDFAALNKLYFDYEDSQGWLSGDFSYRARFSEQTKLVGNGRVRVEDGNVFAIPILGPFSWIINGILPGAGYENARLATADFSVANQAIHTDSLEIVGDGFGLLGSGNIFFMADELDMDIRLNARGTPGIFLFPVSKFFEYSSSGSLSDPVWRPKNLPRELYGEGIVETVTAPVRQILNPAPSPQPPSKTKKKQNR